MSTFFAHWLLKVVESEVNDRRGGLCAAEWSGSSEHSEFVLSGEGEEEEEEEEGKQIGEEFTRLACPSSCLCVLRLMGAAISNTGPNRASE